MTQATIISYNMPTGWTLSGSHPQEYDFGDHEQLAVASIKSVADSIHGYGTLMRTIKATAYAGRKIKLTGRLKSENVIGFAGLWLRISGAADPVTRFDNMQNRDSVEDGWKCCECLLEVTDGCTEISFGAMLHGSGQLWIREVGFEIIQTDIAPADFKSRWS